MSYWYLATPYTNYPDGHQAAFDKACSIAASLMKHGIPVFCPIAHSHPIAWHGIDPIDAELWKKLDAPFVDSCMGIIVAKMRGWETSGGVAHEIDVCRKANKPILYLEVGE
jgi:hypothetical protein